MDAEADVSQKHDSPLSESGKKELSQVREWFEGLDIHKVYYSPYERARQTAVELFGHRNLPTEELDFVHEFMKPSRLVGIPYIESAKYWKENVDNLYISDWQPEDGESFNQIAQRAERLRKFLWERHRDENVAVVTHGTYMKHIVGKWTMGDKYTPEVFLDLLYRLHLLPNGAVIEFEVDEDKVKIVRWKHE
ncbi:hypothetical protein A2368_02155 [Candidatus Collierbacteria bacterium RIFOXYB1_FULL_49_13]|uniref:Phosphoglycerate mutase n=1 Tax=Candidatus Collierbacteria bacterium RIFOXYB1_FULL_49_13 TaxID=1817728 RepID=A0A1F5FGI3_9BACT|nr:MAG: hypothetical protein A2368_02155 [Candidatus Collierbacteria bacterium RIFOXYB1_FULL_49_13]